jgi:hypothetical protein
VQTLELSEWSGIVVASGDGLVYEVNTYEKTDIILFFFVFFKGTQWSFQ